MVGNSASKPLNSTPNELPCTDNCRLNGGEFFLLNAHVLNYECKCVHVHNLDLKLSTLFIETISIRREFHILITDGKNEC